MKKVFNWDAKQGIYVDDNPDSIAGRTLNVL